MDARAAAAGLAPGRLLADARAACPHLRTGQADPAADAAALERLARWCARWTPHAAASSPPDGGHGEGHGIYLDLTGADHLFGGEEALARDIIQRLFGVGVSARVAIAPAKAAARALACFDPRAACGLVQQAEGLADAIAALPVEALGADSATTADLRALGLQRIAAVLHQPRAGLVRRFGKPIADRLDAVLGRSHAPIRAAPAPALYAEQQNLAEPILTLDAVCALTQALARKLAARLEAAGLGARQLDLSLYGVDGEMRGFCIRLAEASADAAHFQRVLNHRLEALAEHLDPGFGFDAATLSAPVAEPTRMVALRLALDDAPPHEEAGDFKGLGALADRLAARLGEQTLSCVQALHSHLPERAQTRRTTTARTRARWPAALARRRPLFLLAAPEPIDALAEVPDGPPRQFRWRRALHRIVRAEGPERIAPEWWRTEGQSDGTRDYWRVEDDSGRRFWVFRAGLYGRDALRPQWFLHGVGP